MSEIDVKLEKDDNENSNDSLNSLTALLEEVKKEEQIYSGDDEGNQTKNNKNDDGPTLPDSFFDDLYREELEAEPTEASTDDDILRLEEMIAKKKRILHGVTEDRNTENNSFGKSRSRSPDNQSRKRKENENPETNNSAKRLRNTTEESPSNNEVPLPMDVQPVETGSNDPAPTTEQAIDPETELENLLKTEDYNSDEEPATSNQKMQFNNMAMQPMQPMFGFPNAMSMMQGMFNPATNPMMANMPVGNYPMMGYQPGFFPQQNMVNMQMMGYGFPQMNVPVPSNENEVECLPVANTSGLPKIPFKRIKLEKADNKVTAPPVEDIRKKITADCTLLLNKLEFPERSVKFVYTPTVTKLNNTCASNSILQKVTNVSFNFQSIGPKQNLGDWGLRAIPDANAEIAKKISLSADRYFSKISENANTTARKLIKEEVKNADKIQNRTEEMEIEEATLSSFFKNSMTQTDPLSCTECVARKRKVGHAIAVQATVFTGSIGSQTDPEVRFNEQLTEGLTNNQLKAMYEFSLLIREPPKNTTAELRRLPEQLLNMYNLSQRQHKGPVPFVDGSASLPAQSSGNDPRRFAPLGLHIHSVHSLAENYSGQSIHMAAGRMPNHSHQAVQGGVQPQAQPQHFNTPSYPQQRGQMVQQNNSPRFPGPRPTRTGYDRQLIRPQQSHSWQHRQSEQHQEQQEQAVRNNQYPDLTMPDFPGHEIQKKYGRGGLRR